MLLAYPQKLVYVVVGHVKEYWVIISILGEYTRNDVATHCNEMLASLLHAPLQSIPATKISVCPEVSLRLFLNIVCATSAL